MMLNILYIYFLAICASLSVSIKYPGTSLPIFLGGCSCFSSWLLGLLCVISKTISSSPVLFHLYPSFPSTNKYWSKFRHHTISISFFKRTKFLILIYPICQSLFILNVWVFVFCFCILRNHFWRLKVWKHLGNPFLPQVLRFSSWHLRH